MTMTHVNIGFGHIPSYQDDNMIIPARTPRGAQLKSYVIEDVPDVRRLLVSKAARHLHIGYVKNTFRVLVTGGVYALIVTCVLPRDEPSRLASVVPALCGLTDCGQPGAIGPRPGTLRPEKGVHAVRENIMLAVDRAGPSTRELSAQPTLIVDTGGPGGDGLSGLSRSRPLNFWRRDGAEWLGIKVQFISADRDAWIADRPTPSGALGALPTADDSIIQGGILSVPSAGLSPAERRKADNRLRAELEGSKGMIYAPATNPFLRSN